MGTDKWKLKWRSANDGHGPPGVPTTATVLWRSEEKEGGCLREELKAEELMAVDTGL